MKSSMLGVALVVICACGVTPTAQAAFIVQPIAGTDTQHYFDGNGSADASKARDGSGFTLAEQDLIDTDSPIPLTFPDVMAENSGPSFFSNFAAQPPSQGGNDSSTATFQLRSDLLPGYSIYGGHFWQFSGDVTPGLDGSGERSLTTADLYVSSDNVSYTFAGSLTPGYTEGVYGTLDTGVDFSLTGTFTNVRYVQFRNMDGVDNQYIRVGFNEIRFFATPEPSSLGLLMIAGMAFFGVRRRQR